MCQVWTHLCPLSQIEVRRTLEQGRAHGQVVLINYYQLNSQVRFGGNKQLPLGRPLASKT
jgi:hypothetical protein